MQPQLFIRALSLTLLLLLMTGCTQYYPRYDGFYDRYEDPYSQANADELLSFGARMSRMSTSSRAKECRTLLKRQKKYPSAGTQLHLMVGRLHSDSCGEVAKILSGVGSMPKGRFNEQTQNLIAIHMDALKHLNTLSKKYGLLGCNQISDESDLEVKDVKRSNKNETRLLREKLDAIRAMEKHLDDGDRVK